MIHFFIFKINRLDEQRTLIIFVNIVIIEITFDIIVQNIN